jgi:dehydrogenase/reductase SDR family protein 7
MELKHFLLSLVGCSFLVLIFPLPLILVLIIAAVLLADADLTLIACRKFGRKGEVLRGQVIWITGASSGIGEYLAYELAKVGCKLILSARRVDELERVKTKCEVLSPSGFKDAHSVVKLDLLDYESHSKCVEEVLEKYDRIDCLVNNAGRAQRGEAVNTSLEVDKAVFNLNILGTISVTKSVLPQMVKQNNGLIVVVSSVAGKFGIPCSAAYSASKHALQGYFDALRMELSDTGIDVLSVCPGPVVSNIGSNSLLANLNTTHPASTSPSPDDDKENVGCMSAQRCADLMVVAMANCLHEVWISTNPMLLFTYVSQYMPSTAMWWGKRFGRNRVQSLRSGSRKFDLRWAVLLD